MIGHVVMAPLIQWHLVSKPAERLRPKERQVFDSAHSGAAIPLTAKSRRCGAVLEYPLLARPLHSVAAHYRGSVRLLQESIELVGD